MAAALILEAHWEALQVVAQSEGQQCSGLHARELRHRLSAELVRRLRGLDSAAAVARRISRQSIQERKLELSAEPDEVRVEAISTNSSSDRENLHNQTMDEYTRSVRVRACGSTGSVRVCACVRHCFSAAVSASSLGHLRVVRAGRNGPIRGAAFARAGHTHTPLELWFEW